MNKKTILIGLAIVVVVVAVGLVMGRKGKENGSPVDKSRLNQNGSAPSSVGRKAGASASIKQINSISTELKNMSNSANQLNENQGL